MNAAATPAPATIAVRRLATTDALAAAIAATFADSVREAVAARGRATVVATGGRTPRAYFARIAALDLPWERVTITLSDERWVDADHPESNERLLREHLLMGRAAAASFVSLKSAAADPYAGCAEVAARLQRLPLPFDLVLLGIGGDSHVASLFPGAAEFDDGVATGAPCIAVTPPAGITPALPRLSLSLSQLLASRRIVLAAAGADKLSAFEQALAGRWPQPSPIPLLAERARQPVEFYWAP
jgi:6-phosphogluconolactonase